MTESFLAVIRTPSLPNAKWESYFVLDLGRRNQMMDSVVFDRALSSGAEWNMVSIPCLKCAKNRLSVTRSQLIILLLLKNQ